LALCIGGEAVPGALGGIRGAGSMIFVGL
jgi:hypothetical protein